MAATILQFPPLPANDNSPDLPPADQREAMRLGIILDWWERELRGLLGNKPHRQSPEYRNWMVSLAEAQDRVSEFRQRIGAVVRRAA